MASFLSLVCSAASAFLTVMLGLSGTAHVSEKFIVCASPGRVLVLGFRCGSFIPTASGEGG